MSTKIKKSVFLNLYNNKFKKIYTTIQITYSIFKLLFELVIKLHIGIVNTLYLKFYPLIKGSTSSSFKPVYWQNSSIVTY